MDELLNESYVYIVCHIKEGQPCGPVKIGMSDNPENRVNNLRSGNPYPLMLYRKFSSCSREHAEFIESSFHHLFSTKRLNGEWFDIEPKEALGLMHVNYLFYLAYMNVPKEDHSIILKNLGFKND